MKTGMFLPTLVMFLLISACTKDEFTSIQTTDDPLQSRTEIVVVEDFDAQGDLFVVDEYEKPLRKDALGTRASGAQTEILIVRLTTDDGTASYTAQHANRLLQTTIAEFWQWHLPSPVDYSNAILAEIKVPGLIPTDHYQALDFVEESVISQVCEKYDLSRTSIQFAIVLLPGGSYGFSSVTSSRIILINSKMTENRLLFTMAHEIGHTYSLNHSKYQLFDNCAYGVVMPVGGDDVMGGQVMRKLNPFLLERLGVLSSIDVNLAEGESQVVWLDPVDEDKSAIRLASHHYVYYRKENDKVSIVEGAYRRKTQPLNDLPVTPVVFNIIAEGRESSAPMDLKVRICSFGYVFMDLDISANGTFEIPLLTGQDLQIWIDAKGYLATTIKVPAHPTPKSIDVLLKCGDITDDGVVNDDDLESPGDINLDGKTNDADLALIKNNLGLAQDEPECEPYFIDELNYEVVFGQKVQIYKDAGLKLAQLFPGALGQPGNDAIWIQLRKVAPRCL